MYFKDIVGQEGIKEVLRKNVSEGRIPHAQLFAGPSGTGKLPMAVAYARYLCCTNRHNGDACGECSSCQKMNKLVHPDVHFMMPVFKRESGRPPENYPQSDDFIFDWREAFLDNPYLSLGQWLNAAGAENQQGEVYVAQANEIIRKLNLRSSEGSYRVVILWMPEKMNDSCANKLLKLIEEPPTETVFLLISEDAELVLPTILSRAQRINFRPLTESDMQQALCDRYSLELPTAGQLAHVAEGSWAKAIHLMDVDDETKLFTDLFIRLMRSSYARKLKEMKQWSEEVARMGRAPQRQFLAYCQRMIRESFICNFHNPEVNYMNSAESTFTVRFAPFVNEKNIFGITEALADAQRDVEANVNAKMIFFDLSLKMIMLLKNN